MLKFAGLNFDLLNKDDILNSSEKLLFVVTANAEIISKINEDENFKKNIEKAHLTFDGQIPYALARFKTGRKDFVKISGSDLIYDIANKANLKSERIFLLGGQEDSNQNAVLKLRELYPNLIIDGYSPPFSAYPFANEIDFEIISKLEKFKPNYLFVGFGAVKQERFISDNFKKLEDLGVSIVIGSGGTFEFVSGKIKRAPKIIQKIGFEGVFRFLMEPKFFRLKRLLISFKIFRYYFKN